MLLGIAQSDVPVTADEEAVWGYLFFCSGREEALQIAEIRQRTGLSERDVKAAVEGLRLRHRLHIGSSRGKPAGYYRIETAEELEATVRALRNQAVKMLRVVHALQGDDKVRLRELLGQMEMEIAKEGG